MLWRKGNPPPPLLEMKIGESQYRGQCGGSLSDENENEVRTFLKPYSKINFE